MAVNRSQPARLLIVSQKLSSAGGSATQECATSTTAGEDALTNQRGGL